eukprot:scaffold431_cov334-Pavlova_lutheri.AAC.96
MQGFPSDVLSFHESDAGRRRNQAPRRSCEGRGNAHASRGRNMERSRGLARAHPRDRSDGSDRVCDPTHTSPVDPTPSRPIPSLLPSCHSLDPWMGVHHQHGCVSNYARIELSSEAPIAPPLASASCGLSDTVRVYPRFTNRPVVPIEPTGVPFRTSPISLSNLPFRIRIDRVRSCPLPHPSTPPAFPFERLRSPFQSFPFESDGEIPSTHTPSPLSSTSSRSFAHAAARTRVSFRDSVGDSEEDVKMAMARSARTVAKAAVRGAPRAVSDLAASEDEWLTATGTRLRHAVDVEQRLHPKRREKPHRWKKPPLEPQDSLRKQRHGLCWVSPPLDLLLGHRWHMPRSKKQIWKK